MGQILQISKIVCIYIPYKFAQNPKNSPRWLAEVQDYDTFLNYQLLFENTFFLISWVLLKISEIFFGKIRLNVWIQFSQIKEKSYFSTSEGGK